MKGDKIMANIKVGGKRPFHETIVEMIERSRGWTDNASQDLLKLIKNTSIPKGHEEIISAIDRVFCFKGGAKWRREIEQVKKTILRQNKPKSKEGGVNLNELQSEAEKLLSLLKDRQQGLFSWNQCMHDCLKNMHELTSRIV